MRNVLIAGLVFILAGCNSPSDSVFKTVKVKEVEQVGNYTYLQVEGKKIPEHWVAVPTMEAHPGETYYYQGGLLMKDFYSQELDRTFDEVLFLEGLNPGKAPVSFGTAPAADQTGMEETPVSSGGMQGNSDFSYETMVTIEKAEVTIHPEEGTVTVAQLYADPDAYKGREIRVKGQVTKYNEAILGRNWVHIQDGTEHEGNFDLTATSPEAFSVGDVVTLQGILVLDKDFGYGYNYKLLLEKASEVK